MASLTLDKICFVISPIGREGTEIHTTFKEVLDFIIKPSLDEARIGLQVLRADDIQRSGSFIKDILEYVAGAYVVIADLTGQNPNVFYELGVRHSLSPRTILMAQSMDDIPSDLREYRTIVYDTSAKGAAVFRQRIGQFLREIAESPTRADSPVLDRIPDLTAIRIVELEQELSTVRAELAAVLTRGGGDGSTTSPATSDDLPRRIRRILQLMRLERQLGLATLTMEEEDGKEKVYELPKVEGSFRVYFRPTDDENVDVYYINDATSTSASQIEQHLADCRLLMDLFSRNTPFEAKFVVMVDECLGERAPAIQSAFARLLNFLPEKDRNRFTLEVWDLEAIGAHEVSLGLRVAL